MNDENITIYDHDDADPDRRETYTVTIFDNRVFTIVTRRASIVRKWIYSIRIRHRFRRNRLVVGLGVQWCPNMYNRPATLQLCVGRQCLIFQIIHANSIPQALKKFLSDASITFVGVRNQNDAPMLGRGCNLSVDRILELGSVANLRGASMEKMASSILGFHGIKKPEWIGRSNWAKWWLTEEQIQYACVDVYLSFEIGKRLGAWRWDR